MIVSNPSLANDPLIDDLHLKISFLNYVVLTAIPSGILQSPHTRHRFHLLSASEDSKSSNALRISLKSAIRWFGLLRDAREDNATLIHL
jgi:hypothetical protein